MAAGRDKAGKARRAAPKVGKSRGKTGPAKGKRKDPAKVAAGRKGRAVQGAGRTPGSGRKAGTPNKRTQELAALLEAAGLSAETHPVVMMYRVYTGEITMPVVVQVREGDEAHNEVEDVPLEPALRVQCMKEVAQYLEAKRKAVEVLQGKDGEGHAVPWLVDFGSLPYDPDKEAPYRRRPPGKGA